MFHRIQYKMNEQVLPHEESRIICQVMWLCSGVVFIKNIPSTIEHCGFHCKEVETLMVLLPCTYLASNASLV